MKVIAKQAAMNLIAKQAAMKVIAKYFHDLFPLLSPKTAMNIAAVLAMKPIHCH